MTRSTLGAARGIVDDACLRSWPLPMPSSDADKEKRGRVLVIGGSRELGGAVVLAGVAALRAGAGKVAIATAGAIASVLAVAFPEARVIALDETGKDGLVLDDDVLAKPFDAVLIGPGMRDEAATCALVARALQRAGESPVVLDAGAMEIVRDSHACAGRRVLLTPHAGELAHLCGCDKRQILEDPIQAACAQAAAWNVTIALKGATTVVAMPDGSHWVHEDGNAGLAMSGSGDTLAGVIVGLAARGALLEQAAVWGVALHARAARAAASRTGALGFLAREIAGEIPALMERLQAPAAGGSLGFTHDL